MGLVSQSCPTVSYTAYVGLIKLGRWKCRTWIREYLMLLWPSCFLEPVRKFSKCCCLVEGGSVFSSVCGCLGVFFVNAISLEPFEISSWNFYGSKICSKASTSSKTAVFRCTGRSRSTLWTILDSPLRRAGDVLVSCYSIWQHITHKFY